MNGFNYAKHFSGWIDWVEFKIYISKHRRPGVAFFAQTLYFYIHKHLTGSYVFFCFFLFVFDC